ncbi:MAG TPA: radical SAM protein [Anaeromyxobacteraceae bacterium]|nr:radical SAM protein [Anaeromyxobacteraceae bacterium]
MRLTLVQPCIGRRPGERYLRSWQMEPLPLAMLAGLTPKDVEVRVADDRFEPIPYDAPTDLVAISVETYTARRAYQIASEYRRRRVPVVMGGFHAMLAPDEVARHAESVVVGEAEALWPRVLDDWRHGKGERVYRAEGRPALGTARPDRSVYRGKRYLPVGLVEAGRGCPYRCDFCAIHSAYGPSRSPRPVDAVVADVLEASAERRLVFVVDDNIAGDAGSATSAGLLEALARHRRPWVTQCSLQGALDDGWAGRLARAGCVGVLIGFESLDPAVLRRMGKGFNTPDRYRQAVATLRRHGIGVYGTFVLGYDGDGPGALDAAVDLAVEEAFFLAAFAPVVPFPGTPLYRRLEAEGRLLYERWWLDPTYRFGRAPYRPAGMTPEALREACLAARRRFYAAGSIARRWRGSLGSARMALGYLFANLLHRREISQRDGHPLGDATFAGPLLEA